MCNNIFHVLGLGAVGWFDMGVWLLLRDASASWLVLEPCEAFGGIFKHGYMYCPYCVIPVNDHAKVPLTIPIMGALVVLTENGGEVFGMLTADVLDAKIIHASCE